MGPSQNIVITDGPIEAAVPDTLNSIKIKYQIVDDANFILPNETKCDVTTSSQFDISLLGVDGLYTISIRAYDSDDEKRENFAIVKIPFQVDRYPPKFTSDKFSYYIPNPKFGGEAQEILTIKAEDGDKDINSSIELKIIDPIEDCDGCFNIESSSGKISWVKEIPKETILKEVVTFKIQVKNTNFLDNSYEMK